MSQTYLQLPLEESSKEFVTINTHKGLFRYNRLPFGVVLAPTIFQQYMETLLRDCKGVTVYLDNILVTGLSVENHLENLKAVLSKFDKAGLHLNKDKCKFMKTKVEYLEHVIDHERLHPSAEKVKAIQEAPKPKDVSKVRSFLGITNYYDRFLPNLSSK